MDRNELKSQVLLNRVRELEETVSELRVDVYVLLEQKKVSDENITNLQEKLDAKSEKTETSKQSNSSK